MTRIAAVLLAAIFCNILFGPRAANASAAVAQHVLSAQFRQQLVAAAQNTSGFENQFQARVWLLDMSTRLKKYVPKPSRREALLKQVHRQADRAGINPQLVLAVIQVESRFKRFAISPAGARGLMQIMPFWKRTIGRSRDNLFQMQTNLRYGCTILAHDLTLENGNRIQALERYNGSVGSTRYPERVDRVLRRHWAVN